MLEDYITGGGKAAHGLGKTCLTCIDDDTERCLYFKQPSLYFKRVFTYHIGANS